MSKMVEINKYELDGLLAKIENITHKLELIEAMYNKYNGRIRSDGSGPWGYEKELWAAVRKAVGK